ncbi:hypothetical protein Tco_1506436 [Tanacetum coccineum]
MESSNSNSKERELQLTQRLAKQRHSICMTWFEQLETHLHDLYLLNSPYAVDAFKPAFRSFFGEEHQTFKLKMFHNLDQLRLQLERENLHGVNAKTCLQALRTQFKEFLASKGVNATDLLIKVWQQELRRLQPPPRAVNLVRSWIESENNNALSTSVNETQLQQHESLVTESTTLEVNLNTDVKALDAGSVITESSKTKSDKHDTREIDQDAEHDQVKSPLLKAEFLKTNDMVEKEVYNELSKHILQLRNTDSPEFHEFFEINELKAQLQAKNSTINNLKEQIKNVHEKSNEAKVKHDIDVIETINIELEHKVAKLLKENEHLKQTYKELYDSIKKTRIQTKDHNDSLIAQVNSKTVENADLKAQIQEKVFANAALKNELRKLNGTSVDTKWRQLVINDNFNTPPDEVSADNIQNKVNSRAKVQSPKIRNNNPVEPKNHTHKPGRRKWYRTKDRFYIDSTTKVDRCERSQMGSMGGDDITNHKNAIKLFMDEVQEVQGIQTDEHASNDTCCQNLIKPRFSAALVVAAQDPVASTVIPPGVEEEYHDIEIAHMEYDMYFGLPILEPSFEESFSRIIIPTNVHSVNQPQEHIEKWTKDHPLDKIIGDPSRPVGMQSMSPETLKMLADESEELWWIARTTSDTKVFTMKMEIILEPHLNKLLVVGFNPLVHSFCALSTLRRSGLRMASAAAKPCQGDSLEFYLITGILTVAAVGQRHVNSQPHAHTSYS